MPATCGGCYDRLCLRLTPRRGQAPRSQMPCVSRFGVDSARGAAAAVSGLEGVGSDGIMSAVSEPRPQTGAGSARAVIIADDHDLVRIGMGQLLAHRDPSVQLGEAADGPALEALLVTHPRWDLMLLDLSMPGFGGELAVRDLLARFPAIPILVVSGTSDAAMMVRLLDAGVAGFLPKSLDGQLMLKAIDLVLAGGRYIPPDVLRAIRGVQGTRPGDAGSSSDPADVTPRQREILALLAQGLPNKVIAARLGIAEATVKMHVTALLRAYGVQSRSELLARLR